MFIKCRCVEDIASGFIRIINTKYIYEILPFPSDKKVSILKLSTNPSCEMCILGDWHDVAFDINDLEAHPSVRCNNEICGVPLEQF